MTDSKRGGGEKKKEIRVSLTADAGCLTLKGRP